MEVDTEALSDGEFVTVYAGQNESVEDEACPRCGCERSDWDCEGCGFEFQTPLKVARSY